jgi:hypothetical protein
VRRRRRLLGADITVPAEADVGAEFRITRLLPSCCLTVTPARGLTRTVVGSTIRDREDHHEGRRNDWTDWASTVTRIGATSSDQDDR